jgi:hypothetical protein
VFGFGIVAMWRCRRELFRGDPALAMLLFVAFAYVVALIGRNYHDYLQLGHLVAINGRYLVLIILPILVAMGMAYQKTLTRHWQYGLLAVGLLLFLQGGGALTFIHESTKNWYWPHDEFANRINRDAQHVVNPFIVDWPK